MAISQMVMLANIVAMLIALGMYLVRVRDFARALASAHPHAWMAFSRRRPEAGLPLANRAFHLSRDGRLDDEALEPDVMAARVVAQRWSRICQATNVAFMVTMVARNVWDWLAP